MTRHKAHCKHCGRRDCPGGSNCDKRKSCSPCGTDKNACVQKFNPGGEWKASRVVHVAGRASRLPPSLTGLREATDPTTVLDTWWRNDGDESSIAVNPTNPCNMIIQANQDTWQGVAITMVAMYTLDNGETWNEGDVSFMRLQGASVTGSTVPPQQGGASDDFQDAVDPSVCFDRKGNAYALSLSFNYDEVDGNFQNGLTVAKSTNGGQSWNHLVEVTRNDGSSDFLERPFITADPYRDDTVYVITSNWLSHPDINLGPSIVQFFKSIDGGATWTLPVTTGIASGPLPDPNQPQPWGLSLQVLNDADHTLVVTVMQAASAALGLAQGIPISIFVMRSSDGGLTWTQLTAFNDVITSGPFDPASPPTFIFMGANEMAGYVDTAYNKQNDTLYMAWPDPRFNPNLVPGQTWRQPGAVVSKSTDGGLTWSAPVPINPTTLGVQTFMPSIAVLDNGIVAVSFYDIRNYTGGASLETDAWVSFFDKDLNFLDQVRVTEESFDMRQCIHRETNANLYLCDFTTLRSRGEDFISSFTITNPPYGVGPAPVPGVAFTLDDRPRQDTVFSIISHSK